MKASKAQSIIIKQQKQILALLTMIAAAAGLEPYDIQAVQTVGEPITPIKKQKRTKQQVEEDLAKIDKTLRVGIDTDNSIQHISDDDSGNNSDEPNKLPTIDNSVVISPNKQEGYTKADIIEFESDQMLLDSEQVEDLESWNSETGYS